MLLPIPSNISIPPSKCPSCSQIFDETIHIPKIMPCGHTQCSYCIHYSYNESSMVKCTVCPTWHIFADFPIDMKIIQTLRQIKKDQELLKTQDSIIYKAPSPEKIYENFEAMKIEGPTHFSENSKFKPNHQIPSAQKGRHVRMFSDSFQSFYHEEADFSQKSYTNFPQNELVPVSKIRQKMPFGTFYQPINLMNHDLNRIFIINFLKIL